VWNIRYFSRFDLRCGLSRDVWKHIKTHFWALSRNGFFFWVLKTVQETEVQTAASIREKEWVSSTMGIVFAFNIIMWIFQCVLSVMSINAKASVIFGLLIYIFSNTIFEFISHLFDGYTLL
jgi:hypothetical protein